MVKSLSVRRVAVAAMLLLATSVTFGQTVDPTRPPNALMPEELRAAMQQYTGPVLQSVLLSRGRKIAIISGKAVRENEKYNGARVAHIKEDEVVLRNGKHIQILKLFPDVKKQVVQRGSGD